MYSGKHGLYAPTSNAWSRYTRFSSPPAPIRGVGSTGTTPANVVAGLPIQTGIRNPSQIFNFAEARLGWSWFPALVVCIPAGEYQRFRKEYEGHLADKSLRRRTAAEWKEQRDRERVAYEAAQKVPEATQEAPAALKSSVASAAELPK